MYGTFLHLLYEQLHVQTPHLLRVSVGSQVAATSRSNKGSLTLTSARPPIQFPLCFERARTTAFDAVHKKARRKPRTLGIPTGTVPPTSQTPSQVRALAARIASARSSSPTTLNSRTTPKKRRPVTTRLGIYCRQVPWRVQQARCCQPLRQWCLQQNRGLRFWLLWRRVQRHRGEPGHVPVSFNLHLNNV